MKLEIRKNLDENEKRRKTIKKRMFHVKQLLFGELLLDFLSEIGKISKKDEENSKKRSKTRKNTQKHAKTALGSTY